MLAASTNDGIARRASLLPCSKAKIKFAFYTYIPELVNLGLFKGDIANNLVTAYSAIDSFIEDIEASNINEIGKKMKNEWANSVPEELRNKYFQYATNSLVSIPALQEIEDYIRELTSH